jgi:hypothetical protein
VDKLKKVVTDFTDKVNRAFKDTLGSTNSLAIAKCCKKEDCSEKEDLNVGKLDIIEPVLANQIIELNSSNSISVDTLVEPDKCEVIAKPEEAGGTISITSLNACTITFI